MSNVTNYQTGNGQIDPLEYVKIFNGKNNDGDKKRNGPFVYARDEYGSGLQIGTQHALYDNYHKIKSLSTIIIRSTRF